MSSVCVLSPVVIAAWPSVVAAAAGVAASMGFTMTVPEKVDLKPRGKTRVETEVPNSEVLDEHMEGNQKIVLTMSDVRVELGRDERGAICVCVTGESHSKAQLERIGQDVAGRLVQQFAYHKLVTELKERNYNVVEESVQQDQSIQMRVRLGR